MRGERRSGGAFGSIGRGVAGAIATRGGISPLNAPEGIRRSYQGMYDRLDNAPDRLNWLSRNGYGPRAFGIPYGYRIGEGRHGGGRRPALFHDSDISAGVRVRFGWRNCFDRLHDHGARFFPGRFGFHRRYSWCQPAYYPVVYSSFWPTSFGWCWDTWNYAGLFPDYYAYNYGQPYVENYVTNYYNGLSPGEATNSSVFVNPRQVVPLPEEGMEGAANVPGAAESHYELGMQAFANGEYDLARREFVRAMLAMPNDPELMMLYGYAHFATGDYMVAALSIRQALTADPTLIDQPVDIYQMYKNPDDLKQQLAKLDEHLAKDKEDADGWFLAGFIRYASGEPEQAKQIFSQQAEEHGKDLLTMLMRDAAIRAVTLQQAMQRESASQPVEEAPSSAPAGVTQPPSF